MYTDSESILGIIDEVLGTGGDGELGGDELRQALLPRKAGPTDAHTINLSSSILLFPEVILQLPV